MRVIFRRSFTTAAHMDHRDIRSQKTNLFDFERQRRVLINGVEYPLVPLLDCYTTLDVVAVDDDVVRIIRERRCEERSALGVPTRHHLLHIFANGSLVGSVVILGKSRMSERKERQERDL